MVVDAVPRADTSLAELNFLVGPDVELPQGSFPRGTPTLILHRMLSWLRHSRAMALAMVLLAPGISGTAVQLLHACPAEALVADADRQHGSSHSETDGHSGGCECIGFCHSACAVAMGKAPVSLAVVVQPNPPVLPSSVGGFAPAARLFHLLPPATAPPLS